MSEQSQNYPLIDEQEEQQHLLAEALEKADLAVQAKNTFLSHISHEMRTPLNAIFGFTTLAKSSLEDRAAVGEYLDQIEIAARQLLEMIDQTLEVSTLNNAAGFAQEECDLEHVLREAYDFLMPQAKERSIRFTLDCEGVQHRGVYADTKRLRQLVLNLANNAITYTREGGKVEILLREERLLPESHALYRLDVKDNGIGIGEESLAEVFEPFTREKTSSLSSVRGIGLGLTIVKKIVDGLKGDISVQTTVGEGSTFTVTLPLRLQSLPGPSKGGGRPSLRILLAEDNDLNREIEAELLQRMGFVVVSVIDGAQALEKVKESFPGDYDLIVMDIQMPGLNGWQVASAIRALPDPVLARIPIIALSANVGISDRHRSLESGIDLHLPKPMELDVLLEAIEKITKSR